MERRFTPRARLGTVSTAIQHFLITRFNLRLAAVAADKSGRPVRTGDWLEERIALFERYCLPSVLHQKRRDFRWLILLDEISDPALRDRAARWVEASDGRIEPVYLPPVRDNVPIAAAVTERVHRSTRILVTTRLDNDDALHEDALSAVRDRVRGDRREFLNLRMGFSTDGRIARVVSHRYSPFVTLVEPRSGSEFVTVHCGLPHGRLRRLAPVRQIDRRPLWLRVLHGRNAANLTGGDRTPGMRGVADVRVRIRRLGRSLRRRTWPPEWRRVYDLGEIAGGFHVGEY